MRGLSLFGTIPSLCPALDPPILTASSAMVRLTLRSLRRPTAAVAALLLASPAALLAQPPAGGRAMTLADWYRVVSVSSPAVSPDGKRVAMTVTKAVDTENKRHSEVWVVNTAGGAPQRWTSPSTESSTPRWSPDGKYLFFTSPRAGGPCSRSASSRRARPAGRPCWRAAGCGRW